MIKGIRPTLRAITVLVWAIMSVASCDAADLSSCHGNELKHFIGKPGEENAGRVHGEGALCLRRMSDDNGFQPDAADRHLFGKDRPRPADGLQLGQA